MVIRKFLCLEKYPRNEFFLTVCSDSGSHCPGSVPHCFGLTGSDLNWLLLSQGGSALVLVSPADGTFTFCVQLFHASSQKLLSQEEFLPSYARCSLWESVGEKRQGKEDGEFLPPWLLSDSRAHIWEITSSKETSMSQSLHPKSGYKLSSQDTSLLFFLI